MGCKYFILSFVLFFGFQLIDTKAQEHYDFKKEYSSVRALIPNELDSAISKVNVLLENALQVNDDEYITKSYYLLGIIHYYKSEFYISGNFYQKALNTPYIQQDSLLREYVFNNVGVIYDKTDEIVKALEAYQESLKLAEKRVDSTSMAQTWINIGLLFDKQKKIDQAFEITNKALRYFEQVSDSLNMALCYQNLSKYSSYNSKFDIMLMYMNKALNLFEALGDSYSITKLHYNLSIVYTDLERYKEAEYHIDLALKGVKKLGLADIERSTILQLANIRIIQNKFKEAQNLIKKAETIIKDNNLLQDIELFYLAKMSLYAKNGEFENYSKASADYSKVMRKEYQKNTSSIFEEMLVIHENEQITNKNNELENKLRIEQLEKEQAALNRLYLMIFAAILAIAGVLVSSVFYMYGKRSKFLYLEIADKNQELSKLLEFRKQILSIVGHDMRNMIAPLNGFLSLFNNKSYDYDDFVAIAPMLEENTEQIQLMFENLQSWADSQDQDYSVISKDFRLKPIMNEIAMLFASKSQSSMIEILINCSEEKVIHFDQEQFRQIVRNLVHNALKFTPMGGKVELSCEQLNDDIIKISVKDSGVGMSVQMINSILENSGRVSTPGLKNEYGTGLGLQVIKRFLHLNDSRLSIESKAGVGSEFSFEAKRVAV